MKRRIHINQHKIKSNRKNGLREPVITIKSYKDNISTNSVDILDAGGNIVAKVIYSQDKPLDFGATVWIETDNDVKIG